MGANTSHPGVLDVRGRSDFSRFDPSRFAPTASPRHFRYAMGHRPSHGCDHRDSPWLRAALNSQPGRPLPMHCPALRVTFQAGPTRSSSSMTTAAARLQTTARGCCSRRRKTSDAQRDTRWCTAGSMASSCAAPLGWVILSINLLSYLILSLSLKYLYLISWAGRAPLIHHPSCGCVHSP